ncbi:TPA: AAA family ATPase [Proteus mirabilis]|uniref:AAA family ATPase n=1 Tax=Proteus mirabilis TaxID=584 RepID=UPI0029E8B65C|nr:AAA family ATPase [Proteus mirabilis]
MANDIQIESFGINKLYGYKNIFLKMKGKTTIFVSENGSGKTTILNAIRFVLSFDYRSLALMDFESIKIKFKGYNELTIENRHLFRLDKDNIKKVFIKHFSLNRSYFEENRFHDLLVAIINITNPRNNKSFRDIDILKRIYMDGPFSESDFEEAIEEVNSLILGVRIDKSTIFTLRDIIGDNEIIFLPTYRRVEKNINMNEDENVGFRRGRRWGRNLHHDGISYGLKDVEMTLKEISIDIERISNSGYRSLSARMLDDLISHGNKKALTNSKSELPPIGDLERFLSRVDSDSSMIPAPNRGRIGRRKNKDKRDIINSIKNLYQDDKVKENAYLYYFLSQLNIVINETKEQESKIEKFVDVCNKYLTSAGDSKSLRFDPQNLEVIVNDDVTNEKISLNDLSSGEKQVISLMAIIYLSNINEKIILIDEPELSLSLDWQRMILPDLSCGDNVNQVIAITHSPFIFDNELEKSATSMKISRD